VRKDPQEQEKPERHAELSVVAIEGALEARTREGAKHPTAPWTWTDAESLVAKGAARFTLASGVRVSLRAGAEVNVDPREGIALAKGDVFCEVPHVEGMSFQVHAVLGDVKSLGTEFAVSAGKTLLVTVVEGAVEAGNALGKKKVAAGESSEVRANAAPGSPKKADLATLAWRFELDGNLPRGARILWKAPSLASTPSDRGPGFFAEVSTAKDATGFPVGAGTYLRFRYRTEKFGPKDHFKVQLKDASELNFGGFVLGLARERWTSITLKITDAPGVSDRAAKLGAGGRLHQVVFLARTEDATPSTGASFRLDDIIIFEAPGDVPTDAWHVDPK
jgi:hypothetical protein